MESCISCKALTTPYATTVYIWGKALDLGLWFSECLVIQQALNSHVLAAPGSCARFMGLWGCNGIQFIIYYVLAWVSW